jgi:hypothetical protein
MQIHLHEVQILQIHNAEQQTKDWAFKQIYVFKQNVCLITVDKFLTNVKLFHVYIKVHNITSDIGHKPAIIIILKNDKTIIAYHFGQYYCLLQKE